MAVSSIAILDGASTSRNVAARNLAGAGVFYQMVEPEVSTHHRVTTADANAVSIAASASVLRAVRCFNKAAYPIYIKFHNTAVTPTAGSGVAYVVAVQAGQSVPDPRLAGGGRAFSAGIGMTVVKDLADAGTTAVAASDAVIEVEYHAA